MFMNVAYLNNSTSTVVDNTKTFDCNKLWKLSCEKSF